MYLFSRLVLLSFTSLIIKARCQLSDNTPPLVLIDRNWYIRENETIGRRVAQARGQDEDGDPITFGLELKDVGDGSIGPNTKLPFSIDSETGTVYLEESLQGKAGQVLHLWVTIFDGKLSSKTEVNAYIYGAKERYNPSQPERPPPLFNNGGLSNFPGFPSRSTQPNPFNHPRNNYPSFIPKQQHNSFSPQSNVPPEDFPLHVPPKDTTLLKPVQVKKPDVISSTTKKTEASTRAATEKSTEELTETTIQLATQTQSVKPNEVTATVIPVISVIAVFLAIGIFAVIFRKKICLGQPSDTKDDMRKESSGGVVLQEDSGLNLHEWRGPRAYNNRYEPWQTDNHTPIDHQLSGTIKKPDHWEYPRHRLKFFNILGEGAFGQVWKCEALDLEGTQSGVTVVAVKTLKENANEKERSDLISELQVMKMLEPHPNVVRLLGCCTDKEPIFLIMEFISKGKLQSYLRNSRAERYYNNMHGHSRSLTSRDLTSFVYQVAKGMEFLSNNGIIHRDLAARNILITEEHTCKVADFGFARDVIASHVYERKSEGRLPIRWMAPESLYDNIFTVKSDVWSFGVLIWEVVTLGSTPYPGMSAVEVMKKVRDGFRLDKPEHCRRELYNIMYYCWDKDPKQRPSFTECLELLEKLLMSETDYIELERFPDHSYYNMMGLSGEKL
ncbi:tyrosine kinase receptor Cad96Ca [Leptinotarsa decemlineata]|uniref:tyrosine kinase receptor Cad96Ca n=1 Tax=Leptinotarsa decemlineata TaxID=7539 RepID=UPI003D304CC1